MTSTHGWPRRLAPLVVSQAFLWITLGLFAFGPWDWPLRNPLALYAFVIGAHVALAIGYLSVCHRAPSAVSRPCDPNRLVRISLWINLAVLPITSYSRTGQWVPDIVGGLLNPGAAYEKAHIYTESGSNAASYVGIKHSPALVIQLPH